MGLWGLMTVAATLSIGAASSANADALGESSDSARPADDLLIRWEATTSERERQDCYRAHQLWRAWVSSLVAGLERAHPSAPARPPLPTLADSAAGRRHFGGPSATTIARDDRLGLHSG